MLMSNTLENLYTYSDYRQFLRDNFQEKKLANLAFSYRVLAEHCGFKARDYLMRVMSGQKNLSQDGADLLSKYFDF